MTIDPRAVAALLPHIQNISKFVEPCCGESHLVNELEKHGLECVWASDIEGGFDAFHFYGGLAPTADAIITNVPWTRQILHPMIGHFCTLLPTWLLFDSDWAYNAGSAPYLRFCSDIVAVGRLRWIPDTDMTGKDNVSWYRFDARHDGPTRFHGRRQ